MATRRRTRKRRLDIGSLAAVPLGIGIIVLGQIVEGGSVWSLVHGAAALIVFGGTLGAVLLSHSPKQVFKAGRAALDTFYKDQDDASSLADRLVGMAVRGQRNGIFSLESELTGLDDGFLKRGLELAVDGVAPGTIAQVLSVEKLAREEDDDEAARIWDAAAGYAPTLGILGAVLGLIQVMQHLRTPGSLGTGIATAFVATVYGVGSANLLFLPIAGRLRERAAGAARMRDIIAEGLHAISERSSARLVAERLRPLAPKGPRVDDVVARLDNPGPRRVVR